MACSECAEGYIVNDGACEIRTCTDVNCKSCNEGVDYCDECIERYKLNGYACEVANECEEYLSTSECTSCY